jgi:hypothetical protein
MCLTRGARTVRALPQSQQMRHKDEDRRDQRTRTRYARRLAARHPMRGAGTRCSHPVV